MSHSIICFFFKPTHTPGTHVKHTHTHEQNHIWRRDLEMQTHAQSVLKVLLADGGWGQRLTNCAAHGGQHECGLLPEHWSAT